MAQQAGWLWGIVPLAMLWGSANFLQADAVRRDVQARALAAGALAGSAPGARGVSVRVNGRDVRLDGEALSADGAARALAQIQSEFGVRRVLGGLTQVVAQKPYSWSASRSPGLVVLGGFVPDETTAKANIAAARALGSDLKIDDQQVIAFGAPEGFLGLTQSLIADLGKLSSGKAALDDTRFCVEGTAATPEAYLALSDGAAATAPAGFARVACPLNPPLVTPYRWSAEKAASGAVSIGGYYPSQAARREIAQLLAKAFPGQGVVADRSLPASGEPPGFLATVAGGIGDLASLRSGKVEIDGTGYRVSGQGPDDFAACEALRKRLGAADTAAPGIACPPPPAPPPAPEPLAMPALPPTPPLDLSGALPVTPAPAPPPPAPARPLHWQADKSADGIALSGLVPDAAARTTLNARARSAQPAGSLTDRLVLEPNLRGASEFDAATGFALDLLARLDSGTVAIDGANLSVTGSVADAARWTALNEALRRRPLPGSLAEATGRVLLRPYAFSASLDEAGVTLEGHLPDDGARQAIGALVAASQPPDRVRDRTTIIPGAPPGFGVAARGAVIDLLRLDGGTARVVDQKVGVNGLTCRELIRSEIATSVGSELPPGFTGEAEIGLRQSGCAVDPPSTCQSDLDGLTQRYYVMFGQGTAVVKLDPVTERAIAEAFAILKQCPTAHVVVEGHTNQDGERAGFNNRDLSLRRAGRVREELIRRGIDPERLTVRGYGVERPLAPHDSAEAKVRNRRVQFTVSR